MKRVTADGSGVVSHVGAVLLRMLADRVGLTQELSGALARRGWWPGHDRGRVAVDRAVMIADGGEAICDIDVLRHQGQLFGPVGSAATCWRVLDEIGDGQLRRIARARAQVRARVWAVFGAVPSARAAGRDVGDGTVVLDVASTIVRGCVRRKSAPCLSRAMDYQVSTEAGMGYLVCPDFVSAKPRATTMALFGRHSPGLSPRAGASAGSVPPSAPVEVPPRGA
jgi:hypothetical protein